MTNNFNEAVQSQISAFIYVIEVGEKFAWFAIDPFEQSHYIDWYKNKEGVEVPIRFKSRERANKRAEYVLGTNQHWLGMAKGMASEYIKYHKASNG